MVEAQIKTQCQNFLGIISAISTQRKINALGALYASVETERLFRLSCTDSYLLLTYSFPNKSQMKEI